MPADKKKIVIAGVAMRHCVRALRRREKESVSLRPKCGSFCALVDRFGMSVNAGS
jgi:hypothetical protein